ncbi:methylenetetrahydrofolate reductase, partial [Vibrio sp.]|nr:methylenetetrahydrofolate reductase [Vibrio sp.]
YQGVYFIGTTPPKVGTDPDTVLDIANKFSARLSELEYDGTIIYDIQDESTRTSVPRPFPFKHTIDSRVYSQHIKHLTQKPTITYKSVTQRGKAEFEQWLEEAKEYHLDHLVLVGNPSSENTLNFTLSDAYNTLKEHAEKDIHLGGVTIAERHTSKKNEHERLFTKVDQGCQYFISQAVYDVQATINLITRYARHCAQQGVEPKRIILTFAPCGNKKTLEFMEWLGIAVPEATQWRLLDSEHTLTESIKICQENLNTILQSCSDYGVPLGLNIESLTNRKKDIDASIHLYKLLKPTMELCLAEKLLELKVA